MTGAQYRSRGGCEVEASARTRRIRGEGSKPQARRNQSRSLRKNRGATKVQQGAQWTGIEQSEDNRKMIESMSEGSDVDMERTLQNCRAAGYEVLGWDEERVETMERGLWWAMEARRKGRDRVTANRRNGESAGSALKRRGTVRGDANTEHGRAGRDEWLRGGEDGRGSAGLVRGRDERCRTDETSCKGTRKGNGGKEENGCKGGSGSKGARQREEEERAQVAPHMAAGASHL